MALCSLIIATKDWAAYLQDKPFLKRWLFVLQAAYLVGISDPASEPGRPGVVDQSQFARANQAIQMACQNLTNPASSQQQVSKDSPNLSCNIDVPALGTCPCVLCLMSKSIDTYKSSSQMVTCASVLSSSQNVVLLMMVLMPFYCLLLTAQCYFYVGAGHLQLLYGSLKLAVVVSPGIWRYTSFTCYKCSS